MLDGLKGIEIDLIAHAKTGLLVFWGGVQNQFWAFGHNPTEYAKKIHCPTLLIYGALDEKVSRKEIDDIFKNINGTKALKIFERAGHENLLPTSPIEWTTEVSAFTQSLK